MKRIAFILFTLLLTLSISAQKKVPNKQYVKTQKKAKTIKKAVKPKGKTVQKTAIYTNASIRGLQGQRSQIQKKIKEQEQALRKNQADVKERLNNLLTLNSQIDERQKNINGIEKDIHHINGNIDILKAQLQTLEQQLADHKSKYIKSMRYMAHHRTVQDKLMFIFSADNFRQMYRRLRYTQEYVKYQRVQGHIIAAKEQAVREKRNILSGERTTQHHLLSQGKAQQTILEGQQRNQQVVVTDLNKKQAELQATLAQQQRQFNALNAKIDQLIRAEIEAAERRRKAEEARRAAEAEARKKAADAARKAAEERRRAAEVARKAEAEARRAEAEARRKAAEAERKAEEARRRGEERAAREARAAQAREEARAAAQAKAAAAEAQRARTATEEANRATATAQQNAAAPSDARLSGSFASNQGRLPMPITGNYTISSHFGAYNVNGLNGVTLDNKGINLTAPAGAQARSVFDGEVTAIFSMGGMTNVLVRHGSYITVYCNLAGASVRQGQRVSARQVLGNVARDASGNCTLHFQLRHETQKLNPERWLRR